MHQFGSNLTVTLNGQYNILKPVWNDNAPGYSALSLIGCCSGLANIPLMSDWLQADPINPVPGGAGAVCNYFATQ